MNKETWLIENLHSTWYFDEEREKQKTPINKELIGKWIKAEKQIARMGYLFSYMDFAGYNEEFETARDIIFNQLSKVSSFNSEHKFSDEQLKILDSNIHDWFKSDGVPSHLKYKARNILLNQVYKKLNIPKYRHIWYDTRDDIFKDEQFKITGIKHCWIGEYVAPSSSSSYNYDAGGMDYDYDPGGLNNAVHHSVYIAQSNWLPGTVYIHPLDVVVEDEKLRGIDMKYCKIYL